MDTRQILLMAALKVLEEEGESHFSTRSVCAIARVTAPTLYHHYGSADGLLSAALAEAFAQFLERKMAAVQSTDQVAALREGWDDYVRFAAARPRLYAVMMSSVLKGGQIQAAEQAFALLIERVTSLHAEGRLARTVNEAADVLWASANAAGLLHVTARLRKVAPPTSAVLDDIRDRAMQAILISEGRGKTQ
jgi:AcrR family transcriptional regulator